MTKLLESCPTGCGRKVLPGHLTCKPCWTKVPKHLQDRVYATWRAYNSTTVRLGSPEQRRARLIEYRGARDNALAAIA